MNDYTVRHSFGELFKLYRLRAGIETLSSFANMMAEHGMVYENSLYSRWQRNERVPRDRKVILLVAQILNEHGGINTKEEVDLLLESTDQRELTEAESHQFEFDESSNHVYEQPVSKTEKPIHIFTTLKHALFSTKITYFILALLIAQTVMFSWVWNKQLYGTFQAYFVGYTYGYIALIGIYYGLSRMNKSPSPSTLTTTIKWLCFGLLSQFVGLQIWTIYNLQGTDVPYPSIADFGYLGLIPCYLYATLVFIDLPATNKVVSALKKNILAILAPILMITIAMLTYFSIGRGVDMGSHVGDVLDIVFPVGETIPMTILLYAFIFGSKGKSRLDRYTMGIILFGFFLQFLAEYSFIFSASLGAYVNTNIIDYIYCISYSYMALTIVMLTNMNKLYNSNMAVDEARSPKHTQNSSRLLSALNPIQN